MHLNDNTESVEIPHWPVTASVTWVLLGWLRSTHFFHRTRFGLSFVPWTFFNSKRDWENDYRNHRRLPKFQYQRPPATQLHPISTLCLCDVTFRWARFLQLLSASSISCEEADRNHALTTPLNQCAFGAKSARSGRTMTEFISLQIYQLNQPVDSDARKYPSNGQFSDCIVRQSMRNFCPKVYNCSHCWTRLGKFDETWSGWKGGSTTIIRVDKPARTRDMKAVMKPPSHNHHHQRGRIYFRNGKGGILFRTPLTHPIQNSGGSHYRLPEYNCQRLPTRKRGPSSLQLKENL